MVGAFVRPGVVGVIDMDALITGAQAARLAGVTRAAVCIWRNRGRLEVRRTRGRSPLYRLGDVLDVERETRQSGKANRGPRGG